MISMGSSFTFAGLKDTLLAVRQGIECKLSKVSHLAVNYRTTRDVLLLGNEILSVAKRAFPEAIRFAYPETSKKDLGISVVLCDWAATFSQTGIRLGRNQALIYSSSDPEAFEKAATDWIGSHPFILSSLDSKGLEFDDVIVAFDLDRKTWRVEEKRIATLRMLRELYVAVTRAQRRVVILIQKNIKSMQSFFDELQYDFQVTGAEFVRMEFDQETTAEMWRQKGHDLFDDAQYFMASRCFDSSGDRSWSQWAKGRHLQELGNKPEAIEAYHLAFVAFFDCEEFERALDVALMLTHFALWSTIDSKKLDFALRKCPEYLERTDVVRLTLLCGRWDEVTIEDFKEAYLSDIFMIYRENQVLKSMVKGALDADRTEMEDSMPAIVGDYYRDVGASDEAVRLYIQAQDMNSAQDMTNAALESFKTSGNGQAVLSRCVDHWKKSSKIPKERKTALLLDMFWSPTKTAKSSAQDCMRLFGRSVVIASVDYAIASVDYAKLDRCALYDFSTSDFIVEVTDALVLKFPRQLVEVVRWFASRNKFQATQFTKKRLSKWTNKEICSIAVILRRPEEWISNELHKRKELGSCILAVMGSTMLSPQGKLDFADTLLKHKLLLTGTEQSLVDLVCKLFHKELDVGDISSLVDKHIHGFPWSEDNLIRLAQKLKGVAQILKTAEPTSHVEYPALYAGFYRRVATNDLIKAIETTPQNDQSWLLRAFAHYEIPIERHVPVSFAIDFMGWAFQAELPEVALQMTWKALSIISPTSAQTHWFAAVVDQWQSEEKYRPWLLERHQDQQQQQVWEILVTANPRVACRESGDCILASLLYYGPALTRYWWAHRGESYSATALARWEEHVKQLCVALAERKVAGVSAAGSSNTNINNAGKTNGKSKKKKNVGKKNNRKK